MKIAEDILIISVVTITPSFSRWFNLSAYGLETGYSYNRHSGGGPIHARVPIQAHPQFS